MSQQHKYPKPRERFKPRAHAGLLSAAVQAAWLDYRARNLSETAADAVSLRLTEFLEARHPADDMAILARYGVTTEISDIAVRIFDGQYYGNMTSIPLKRKVVVASSVSALVACATRHSLDPARGVTAEYRARCSEKEWAELVQSQDDAERHFVPDECNAYFAAILAGRTAFKAEYTISTGWPEEVKSETGAWPTWEQIAAKFPVLGAYLETAERAA